uniref:NADH dehydrogenase subunit 6 n=1 Tax=Leucophytia bidentata TaxID=999262 RepID=G8HMU0_9EUPU|nr:NADH dehydrogenase subunit 6 [Leucophytia bidentata]AEQ93814.1 NADH dehydrogenase subunit 6 [Leucophytia bidentata]
MFELSGYAVLLFFMVIFLVASFPLLSSPIGLGGVLVLISFNLVCLVSLLGSGWYAYLLFLVYIGGLLVLFIYVCMVSSNKPLSVSPAGTTTALLMSLIMASLFVDSAPLMQTSGCAAWESGAQLSLALYVGLVTMLLIVFLAVSRILVAEGGALAVGDMK